MSGGIKIIYVIHEERQATINDINVNFGQNNFILLLLSWVQQPRIMC
jgi:hypothetical protein